MTGRGEPAPGDAIGWHTRYEQSWDVPWLPGDVPGADLTSSAASVSGGSLETGPSAIWPGIVHRSLLLVMLYPVAG